MYRRKYKTHLKSIKLPLQTFTQVDVTQAIKDVERETLVVNGVSTKGGLFVGEGLQVVLRSSLGSSQARKAMGRESTW